MTAPDTTPARFPRRGWLYAAGALSLLFLGACGEPPWNNPHPPSAPGEVTYQSIISYTPPKHLDPAKSYATDESLFIAQVYEPPMDYHFLKRPYELVPGALSGFPELTYLDANGDEVARDDPALARTRYTLRLRDDLRYQPHPAFALDDRGRPLYLFATAAEGARYRGVPDFPETGDRHVLAADYAYAIKRLADPLNGSPMLGIMSQYIVGMRQFSEKLGGLDRNGWLDLDDHPMAGLEVVDERTLAITIEGRYPQFVYWLAMHFFAPVPREADRFYHNPGFEDRNLTLDWWPVGSGPFMLVKNDPNSEIILERNPNFRTQFYPAEGAPGDLEAGYLDDAGKPIPFIDRAVFTLERELLPLWTKFLQGYYDRSGEVHGNTQKLFDQAFVVGPDGPELSPDLEALDLSMAADVKPGLYYYGFNMRDPVVGGYTEKKRKLRRALQIAFNVEDYIKVFHKGGGLVAHSPIPPGIEGHLEGEAGINPYTHDWVDGEARRKSLDRARQLLAEAGYPNGRHAETGEPLRIYLDVQSQAIRTAHQVWMERAFAAIGVQAEFRVADWARTREKLLSGNTQIYSHGWLADYPDPENFLFLLYGPEAPLVCNCDGVNSGNYESAEYDELFRRMRLAPSGPGRDALVARMVDLFRRDAVWLYAFNPLDTYLSHSWVHNTKRHGISKGTLKFIRVDDRLREQRRAAWNQPDTWPLYAAGALVAALVLPGAIAYRRRQTATARR